MSEAIAGSWLVLLRSQKRDRAWILRRGNSVVGCWSLGWHLGKVCEAADCAGQSRSKNPRGQLQLMQLLLADAEAVNHL